ncbi:uncharacterized protein TRIVIDRAFT_230731 [Trichoderma virens Gv29-8]|uniref:ubiquitinyl hydrolase 1 n=1 Tax=Hypocrea virens (strain Gv29-8 / FGSC 10586) TaxID=413071 RepID=G9MSW2_HYPVG|nr:uncharacterized protein TRIVIDRAFT_230731 [Trichoderma virens Gv29-8]EHK23059.1 hypothetical protein TRIVIDRAFT_230731 [Trichoderma virens Gv29-8]UKZ48119.1 hypothetical protein TrVGV298_002355 [Trichoderma virens]
MVHFQNTRAASGFIEGQKLAEVLNSYVYDEDIILPLHISAQNAGVIITQDQYSVVMEAFELSPTNNAVMGTAGRLQRCFPASAISIPNTKFYQNGFIAALAETIEKLSYQEANEAKPKISKKGELQIEERDTTDPFLVTDFLNTVLLAQGGEAKPVASISKNTREEVIWENAMLRWRRSPIWLLTRVTLQLHFERLHSDRLLYKEFMIFLMSCVLDIAQRRSFASDLLYCMRAKIARRLKKLDDGIEASLIKSIHDTLERTSACLQQRWKLLSREPDEDVDLVELSRKTLPTDGSEPYPELDDFIRSIESRQNEECVNQFRAPWVLRKYDKSSIANLDNLTQKSIPFHLSAFEKWVDSSLLHWMSEAGGNKCMHLYDLAKTYYELSQRCYSGCPESLSIASLTILELWMACDKSACDQIPLIKDYSPQIPAELLQSLLLHSKVHLERLVVVERYIRERCSGTLSRSSSIFSSFGHRTSFSVRYYATSAIHKTLHENIERNAREERERKREEFYNKRRQYEELMSRSARLVCEYVDQVDRRTGRVKQIHSENCRRDALLRQADALVIKVHEWPLPDAKLEAQSTVFELHVPSCFSAWRNMTALVINDALQCDYSSPEGGHVVDRLSAYLSSRFTGQGYRFELASTTKSNKRTHRHGKKISTCTKEEDVLVKNGLRYEYYDRYRECFVSELLNRNKFSQSLMFKLSQQNNALQQFIFRPPGRENGLTPNHVLSQQYYYSQELSLEESKTMASLPVGYRLLWENILVQLFTPKIDFNKSDTVLILMQIIHQAGPPFNCSTNRASHQQLCDKIFVERLLEGLSHAVDRIEKNWESYISLRAFIAIAVKTLNCSPTQTLMELCHQFLRRCRAIVISWINLLQNKLSGIDDEEQRREFYLMISQMALICIASFDVDEKHLRVILSDAEQMDMMMQSSIIIQNLSHSVGECTDPFHINLVLQKQRVLHNSHNFIITETLDEMSQGLNSAVKSALSFYNGKGAWKLLSDHEYHWLETKTIPNNGKNSSSIQINILTGELLVNGLPPSRLPSLYEEHPAFRELFGREMIEVMPSDIPGTIFSSMKKHHGYSFAFGMDHSDSPQLIIVATTNDEELDLVPRGILNHNLPASFINNYIHWYNRQSGMIEFRPTEAPWCSSNSNWYLQKTGSAWVLKRPGQTLLCPTSSTTKRICQTLRSLEEEAHMHIIRDNATFALNISLPRLRLDFSLEQGSSDIHCRQFRGMYVDKVQQIGTLVGLQSKLTLRDGQNKRMILVPDGNVYYLGTSGHMRVEVVYGSSARVHPFTIDTRLGRLIDNGSLQSKLCLAYLHALTSYCLPDSLTGKTGTEQCLSILNSAAVRSFQQLSEKDLDILDHISKLSPGRAYYPEDERVMETVTWDNQLSFLSQVGSLHTTALSIIEGVEQKAIFYSEQPVQYTIPNHVDSSLGLRHQIRDSIFCVSGFGAENHTTSQDMHYQSRDRVRHAERSQRAFKAAVMAAERRETIHMPISGSFVSHMWKLLNNKSGTPGPNSPLADEVGYDCRWLSEAKANFVKYWCRLHHSFRNKEQPLCRFRLMFCAATMAYAEEHDASAVQALIACANIPSIGSLKVPNVEVFDMAAGYEFSYSYIRYFIFDDYMKDFSSSPEAFLPRRPSYESDQELDARRRRTFENNRHEAVTDFTKRLQEQWICPNPWMPGGADFSKYVYKDLAWSTILQTWQKWYENHQLFEYLTALGDHLRLLKVKEISMPDYIHPLSPTIVVSRRGFVNQEDLFSHCTPFPDISSDYLLKILEMQAEHQQQHNNLKQLLDSLKQHASRNSEHKYIQDLDDSQKSHSHPNFSYNVKLKGEILSNDLKEYLSNCEINSKKVYCLLKEITGVACEGSAGRIQAFKTPAASVATKFMAPRVSPTFFLGQLARENWKSLPLGWKEAVVTYAESLTMVQRAERMLSQRDNDAELIKELLNTGHTNWKPMDYPESLLLEVESGIMIREVQENIASQMRSPPRGENATMQLNMGEGKSTVILPAVAAYLADGKRLVCVIGTKPQAKELFRMLTSKLGGLMNHQVYQMPFSRSLKFTASDATRVLDILKQCSETGGVLLMQPEHLLSFKLMGIENRLSSQEEVGQILLDIQHYFNTHSRTIVDESDDIFSVKFELIYTMGTQVPIELSPNRWIIVQHVLRIVMRAVHSVRDKLPQSIEISHSKKGRFPRIRILRQDAEDMLLSLLAEEICNAGVLGLPIERQLPDVRQHVREYILNSDLNTSQINSVEVESGFFTESTKGPLLLIRGLIAEGVLSFAFRQKRWRVNYGLALSRVPKTRLAVPYRAKDNPTARSEFSHPDVVIELTALTYYYGGLSDDDLFASFDHLLRADQAEAHYQDWVLDAPDLPNAFRSLTGVTLKDRHQAIHEIFPHFRYAKNAIDYFLSHIVFAKEMREFPKKLSASGWDIGQLKTHPTTGFSGTCDSRNLMPLDMKHLDLPEQRHTNALVLQHILQPENSVAYAQKTDETQSSDAEALLNLVISMEPHVQVILDVGAQILELTNVQLAKAWLKKVPESQGKKAVIYFDDHDELCVIDQQGCVENLQTSPYSQQLDLCLVFLDEAHTRGTDLKLPSYYRAAVTLGPGLTKDRLVQACMRLRKLGRGQSVVFCISEEIQARILKLRQEDDDRPIQVLDVLTWAIHETFMDLHRSIPMWAVQGHRFEKQRAIWESVTTSDGIQLPLEKAEGFLEAEIQSLDDRYRPHSTEKQPVKPLNPSGNPRLEAIWKRCVDFGNTQLNSSVLWEEQEREIAPEILQEREIERPRPVQPKEHTIHPKLIELVTSGLFSQSAPFSPAFEALGRTRAAQLLDVSYFPDDVLVTQDFMSTVILEGNDDNDDFYQRSVQWVLSQTGPDNSTVQRLIVISPHEAQELKERIAESKHVHLHLYTPLPNLAYTSLESLKLYTVPALPENWHLPSRLRLLLNLFSGQLYITSQDDYHEACRLLNLSYGPTEDGVTVEPDGFIISQSGDTFTKFRKSPTMFLRTLLAIRWNSEVNDKTHWGRILRGGLLKELDFADSTCRNIVN